MKQIFVRTAVVFSLVLAVSSLGLKAQEAGTAVMPAQEAAVVSLEIDAALVAGDLSVRPLPKRRFVITCEALPEPAAVVTDFHGHATAAIVEGPCVLRSDAPLVFEGRVFTWEIPFAASSPVTRLELSNDNAQIADAEPAEAPRELDEGEIYRRYRDAVCKVIGEAGQGSGFLIDGRGLIITNHHVVRGSEYLAVKLDERTKVAARLVAEDPHNDLALLRVHPERVAGIEPLALVPDDPDAPVLRTGDRIVAIGSPLATEAMISSGIVGKVERDALHSDVAINPGSSGGPVIDERGHVVGVATFGQAGGVGPGVGGAVRAHLVDYLVKAAATRIAEMELPPTDLLPVEPQQPYPADVLREYAKNRMLAPSIFHLEAGRCDVQFVTPVVIALLQSQAEREAAAMQSKRTKGAKQVVQAYEPGKDFYSWRRYTGTELEAVVTVQVVPEIAMTGGSAFGRIMLGAGMPAIYRFKTDFVRMELLRDGVPVTPIHPGRIREVVHVEAGTAQLKDVQTWGSYQYPWEAFRPGADVELRIWESKRTTPRIEKIAPATLAAIAGHFKPYMDALEKEARGE